MKINFSRVIVGHDGTPVSLGSGLATLGGLVVQALLNDGDEQVDIAERKRRASLADMISAATEPLDVHDDDRALLERRLGMYPTNIAVPAALALEGAEEAVSARPSGKGAKASAEATQH